MKTSRIALVGLGGILLLGAASLLVVSTSGNSAPPVGNGGPPREEASPEGLRPSLPVVPAGVPPAEPPPDARPSPAPPPSSSRGPREASPPGTPWEQVPAFPRASNFGPPLAAAVAKGLEETRTRLETCFDQEIARENARPPVARRGSDANAGPALLVLRMEAHLDALEVADTEVERRGSSSPGIVACCRDAIRGFTMDAPGARPGQRFRLMYPLLP